MKNSKIFPWIVAFTALSVSGSAAYYSVFGIGKMFAGAATNVMIMAGSLEFSKLVIASLLYNYWVGLNKILRTYLTVACCVLVLITSAGIYGFLSAAYQETANKVEVIDKQGGSIDKQKAIVEADIKRYENQITQKDNRINSLSDIKSRQQGTMDNLINKNLSVKGIKTQMQSIDQEISKLDAEVKVLNDSLSSKNEKLKQLDLQSLSLQTNQDVAREIGPLKYIAKLTGKSLDVVVNYFIVALMLVFDPLAISLVIASNFLFALLKEQKTAVTQIQKEEIEEEIETKDESVDVVVEEEEETTPEEDPTEQEIPQEDPIEEEKPLWDWEEGDIEDKEDPEEVVPGPEPDMEDNIVEEDINPHPRRRGFMPPAPPPVYIDNHKDPTNLR